MAGWIVAMVIIVLTQVGDYWTTIHAMKRPGVREANPVVRSLGLLTTKIITCLFYGGVLWMTWSQDMVMSILVTVLIAGWYAWVIWNNIQVARRASISK